MSFEEEKKIKMDVTFGDLFLLIDPLQDGYRVNEIERTHKYIYFCLCKDVFIYDENNNVIGMDSEKSDAKILKLKVK